MAASTSAAWWARWGCRAPLSTAHDSATTLLNRAASADEIAGVVSFFASSRASYITGAIIAADGGRTAI